MIVLYTFRKTKDPAVIEVSFDNGFPLDSIDPFHDFVLKYSEVSGISVGVVDMFYNYKFVECGHKIQFYWNGLFRFYIFYISSEQFPIVYKRVSDICNYFNHRIRLEHNN